MQEHQTISRGDYEQMRTVSNDEIAVAELSLSKARVDEVEIEKILDFA